MIVDSSTISRSTSESGARINDLVLSSSSIVDRFFPLVDQIMQQTVISGYIDVLCFGLVYLQYIVFFMLRMIDLNRLNADLASFLKRLAQFVILVDYNDINNSDKLIEFLFVVFTLTFLVWAVYELLSSAEKMRSGKVALKILRFVFQDLSMVFMTPLFLIFVSSLFQMSSDQTFLNYSLLGLSAISLTGYSLIFYFYINLSSRSACIHVNCMSTFNPSVIMQYMFGSNLFALFFVFFKGYSQWTALIIYFVHSIFCIELIYSTSFHVFHRTSSCITFSSMVCSLVSVDLFHIFAYFFQSIKIEFLFGAILVFGGISYVCFSIYYRKSIDSIKRCLSLSQVGSMTDQEKINHYIELGFLQDYEKALHYLRIGFISGSDLFFDWSLLRFIAQTHQISECISECLQILSFFPCETRELNMLMASSFNRRDLTCSERFLFFQVKRIKMLRQSSSSYDSMARLSDLKLLSKQSESEFRGFWNQESPSFSFFENYGEKLNKINDQWLDAIQEFPNNSKIRDEYTRFLLECTCELDDAIYHKHISELIETGANFAEDVSFRSFLRSFPDYFKKDLVDLSGNILSKKSLKSGSNSSKHPSSSMSGSSIEINPEIEDSIGKKLLHQAKTRIALHHSMKLKEPHSLYLLTVFSIVSIIIILATFGVLAYLMIVYFQTRQNGLTRIEHMSYSRFYMSLCASSILMHYANGTNKIENFSIVDSFLNEDLNKETYINLSHPYPLTIIQWSVKSREQLNSFLHDLANVAFSGVNIYRLTGSLMTDNVPLSLCWSGNPYGNVASNLKDSYAFMYFLSGALASSTTQSTWFAINEFCEFMLNFETGDISLASLISSLATDQIEQCTSFNSKLSYPKIILPLLLFCITFLPLFCITLLFNSEIKKLMRIIIQIDPQIKTEAMNSILKDSDSSSEQFSEMSVSNSSIGFVLVMSFLLSVIESALSYLLFAYFETQNKSLLNSYWWHMLGSNRLSSTANSIYRIIQAVLINSSISQNITNTSTIVTSLMNYVDSLEQNNRFLLQGNGAYEPCFHFDSRLDNSNINEQCSLGANDTSTHDMYRCASSNQMISLFKDMIVDIAVNPTVFGGKISSSTIYHVFHMALSHLLPSFVDFVSQLSLVFSSIIESSTYYSIVLMIIASVLPIIYVYICLYSNKLMKTTYKTALVFVQRLPPLAILNTKDLLNYLLDRESFDNNERMGISQSIIHNLQDSVLCTGISGNIETANTSFTTTFGYAPEQILGQSVGSIFNTDSKDSVLKQLILMKNHQSAGVYQDHVIGITDSGSEIPCYITVLGMKEDDSDSLHSFVIVLRNETIEQKQKKEAEAAKIQSEELLYQILPKDIVMQLNRGEKNISFSVPMATIIFIDIAKFSEYSSSLTPQEILENLSQIFCSFDEHLAKYPLLTKIKLIGDVYMAASGLFSSGEQVNHAEQAIRFCLECISELEEINVKLNSNLNIRVGVNSGGPIISGILGTDKPLFDIIGDPINVASRLQSTGIPGRIHISQATYDLIGGLNFEIEQRGEVFLKGKGKTTTFLINPAPNFISNLSSSDFHSKPDL